MPGLFGKFRSNSTSRKGVRMSALAEVLNTATTSLTPAVSIPTIGAQVLISGYLAIYRKAGAAENIAHGLLGLTSIGRLVIVSMLFFGHINCPSDSTDARCDSSVYLNLIFAALLLALGTVGEFAKDKKVDPTPGEDPEQPAQGAGMAPQ